MTTPDLRQKLIKDIMDTGFPLEMQVSSILNQQGWKVTNGAYFIDKDENKGREIDIITSIHRSQMSSDCIATEIVFSLIIEIKKSEKHPWVFFTSEQHSILDTLLPKKYVSTGFIIDKSDINKIMRANTVQAHERIGKNFYQGFTGNNSRDDIYKALSGTTKALNYFIEKSIYSIESGDKLLEYFEPVVIVKGKLFESYINKEGEMKLDEANYIQTYFNYLSPEYSTINKNVIHVINFDYLEDFLTEKKAALDKFYNHLLVKENNSTGS